MAGGFHDRTRRDGMIHTTLENAFLTANTLLLTLLTAAIIFCGVLLSR